MRELDLRDLLPPLPLVRARQALYGLEPGESLTVLAGYAGFMEDLAELEALGTLRVAASESLGDGEGEALRVELIKP